MRKGLGRFVSSDDIFDEFVIVSVQNKVPLSGSNDEKCQTNTTPKTR